MERLPLVPSLPAQRYSVALDGVQYEIRLVWRARTAAWYLDMSGPDGVPLLQGRRLSPGSSPTYGLITTGPPGALFVFGPDPYAQDGIELWYFGADELVAARPVVDLLPVDLS